ncbi:endonuclease [Anoxybacter fermentans]|uniref:Probable endonuclease 4 n=1 Tax=Anoxybacter fermentans TaxID=1323375 RepID=A0A3S9SVV5_9FIRM|nr:deoxyribonuclease IV [Anoxybacter fermentans]AZR72402.1 endonuclease [Anoxybacter fermentans]
MRVGAHVSIAGGIDKAPERAHQLGCDCLQIFSKNPRGWKVRELSENEANKTQEKLKEFGLDPMVVHITYLINLASPKADLYEKSLNGLITDLIRSGMLGAKYLVLHPGKYTGSSLKDGIKRITESINIAFDKVQNDVILLLENVAGAGTEIGKTFEELKEIMDLIEDRSRIGICFDTCHGFAAGYDIRTEETVDKVFTDLDQVIGIDKLKVIHANDAKGGLGSNLDRHEHIGFGAIGEAGFKAMIHHPMVLKYDIPFILETPLDEKGDFETNIKKMRELAK